MQKNYILYLGVFVKKSKYKIAEFEILSALIIRNYKSYIDIDREINRGSHDDSKRKAMLIKRAYYWAEYVKILNLRKFL